MLNLTDNEKRDIISLNNMQRGFIQLSLGFAVLAAVALFDGNSCMLLNAQKLDVQATSYTDQVMNSQLDTFISNSSAPASNQTAEKLLLQEVTKQTGDFWVWSFGILLMILIVFLVLRFRRIIFPLQLLHIISFTWIEISWNFLIIFLPIVLPAVTFFTFQWLFGHSYSPQSFTETVIFISIYIIILISLYSLFPLVRYFFHWYYGQFPNRSCLDPIDFKKILENDKEDEKYRIEVISSLVNGEKAKPEFTLVAPKAREVQKIVSHLKEEKFAFVNGHSGDGKSLAVYHAVRQIWEEALSQKKLRNPFTWGYEPRIYKLKNVDLGNLKSKEDAKSLAFEMFNGTRGSYNIFIIDDAHLLGKNAGMELRKICENDAKYWFGRRKYVWIETEIEETNLASESSGISIDFKRFIEQEFRIFIEDEKKKYQSVLLEKKDMCLYSYFNKKDLADANERVNKNQISDMWWYIFVAANGNYQLREKLEKLKTTSQESGRNLPFLFLFSAWDLLAGELDFTEGRILFIRDLLENNNNFVFAENNSNCIKKVNKLTKRDGDQQPFIKYLNNGRYRSLHLNTSKAIIRHILKMVDDKTKDDLLKILPEIMTEVVNEIISTKNNRSRFYLSPLLSCLADDANEFIKDNREWFEELILKRNPPLTLEFGYILYWLKRTNPDIYQKIIINLSNNEERIKKMAKEAGKVTVGEFQLLVHLIITLPPSIKTVFLKELFSDDKRAEDLATEAGEASIREFNCITAFIAALSPSIKTVFLEKLFSDDKRIKNLAKKAGEASIGQFDQLAQIINAFDSKKEKFLDKLNFDSLAMKAGEASDEELSKLALLVLTINTEYRSKFIGGFASIEKAQQFFLPNPSSFLIVSKMLRYILKEDEDTAKEFLNILINDPNSIEVLKKVKYSGSYQTNYMKDFFTTCNWIDKVLWKKFAMDNKSQLSYKIKATISEAGEYADNNPFEVYDTIEK
jgi:hypothetical protein